MGRVFLQVGLALLGSLAAACTSPSIDPAERDVACCPDAASPLQAASRSGFDIRFDYRFDETSFFTDEKRILLEWAAGEWQRRLDVEFPEVPPGTPLAVANFETDGAEPMRVLLDEPIDDLLLFVTCSASLASSRRNAETRTTLLLAGGQEADFLTELEERAVGERYEPWVAAIGFACDGPFFFDSSPDSDDDLPNDKQDFLATALHEIGHALGVGTARAYEAQRSEDTLFFLGARSRDVFGGDVPLEDDGHVASWVVFENRRVLMDGASAPRERDLPTRLDLALLEDIGYRIFDEFR